MRFCQCFVYICGRRRALATVDDFPSREDSCFREELQLRFASFFLLLLEAPALSLPQSAVLCLAEKGGADWKFSCDLRAANHAGDASTSRRFP